MNDIRSLSHKHLSRVSKLLSEPLSETQDVGKKKKKERLNLYGHKAKIRI